MKDSDLTGKRYGMLTVEGDSGQRKRACILWRCRCDCGGMAAFTRGELLSGWVENCGCIPRQRVTDGKADDLAGRRFGALTVLQRAENDARGRARWVCRCDCGNECTVPAVRLKKGQTRSCGCQRNQPSYTTDNLTSRRFGRLTVLYQTPQQKKRQKTVWHCLCDCGQEVDVGAEHLLRGTVQSCGCWRREQSRKMHDHMHFQDGTCIERLEEAQRETGRNKAGFRGLYRTKRGAYRVTIGFQRKLYCLGYFKSFAEAVQARLDAEQQTHAGYIRAFRGYERHASADPAWAKDNPFFYEVTRVNGIFHVSTNGEKGREHHAGIN